MSNFTKLHNELLSQGYRDAGCDGKLGHVYEHLNGSRVTISKTSTSNGLYLIQQAEREIGQ